MNPLWKTPCYIFAEQIPAFHFKSSGFKAGVAIPSMAPLVLCSCRYLGRIGRSRLCLQLLPGELPGPERWWHEQLGPAPLLLSARKVLCRAPPLLRAPREKRRQLPVPALVPVTDREFWDRKQNETRWERLSEHGLTAMLMLLQNTSL